MKTLAAFALLLATVPAVAQDVAEPALRADLLERYAAEQDVRMRLIAAGIAEPDRALLSEMSAIDADNLARVVEIVDTHGWPTPELVGADGVNAAFMIVQHADPATQERMLPLVEAAYRAGDLPGQSYAMLLDRVLVVGRGEPQVYGTQAAFGPDGEMVVSPTIDDATLDARRAEVGLPPVAEYLAMLREAYAAPTE
ncbi:DUF6624 domain-containing protein [Rubrivirga sp.]|uniref:DUF6624 domain-containing protein n=1 Tax=Rubrivirga sp. TaxID=1885344 RepID=UPI003B516A1F